MLKGRLRICTPYGGEREFISIGLRDELSTLYITELELTYEDFVRASLGHGEVPCDFKVYLSDKIGKKLEVKREYIDKPDDWYDKNKCKQKVEKAAKKLEVDGWEADIERIFSTRQDGDKLEVIYRRWVQPTVEDKNE